ncbi:MAG: hypothetical protein WBZ32_11360 [Candidatus Acidiferrales bacterium]
MPTWAGRAIMVLALLLAGTLGWQGYEWYAQRGERVAGEVIGRTPVPIAASHGDEASPWQGDVREAIEAAADDARNGNITAAEMGLDRADSIVMAARERGETAAPDFFAACVSALDQTTARHPDDLRLTDHATQVRIELAQLRSTMNPPPISANNSAAAAANDEKKDRLPIYAPRSLRANETLTPASAGTKYLDAAMMPDAAEILLPPSTRVLADGVRVEGMTLGGAAQTLDGIQWSGVTFVGTRLRYEGGEIALHDVRFVRCTFGFPGDERGARLANAIALGQTSIQIR